MSVMEDFRRQVATSLPGFLYAFDFADFKRRNCHLGHETGDRDIAEFDAALKAQALGLSARVRGDSWLMFARADETPRVQALIDSFARIEPIETGWRIEAGRKGETRTKEETVASQIRRAVRCFSAEVKDEAALASATAGLDRLHGGLPVNCVLALEDLTAARRQPWICVSAHPAHDPDCPFCHGRDFAWEDGDDTIYTGSGSCKGCGARIDIRQIS